MSKNEGIFTRKKNENIVAKGEMARFEQRRQKAYTCGNGLI